MNLVDTSGWIEYFFAGPNTGHFAKPIENTADLLVPTICLYEVFKKINTVADEAKALVKYCFEQGLILLACGSYGNIIRTLMPLVITPEQLERGLAIMGDGLKSLEK